MHLIKARITDYRSVEDSETFDIEDDVTCLVGKNESGKTTLLQALYRLNPVEPVKFDEVIDFPARKTKDRKGLPEDEMVPVVRATFLFDPGELKVIEEELGPKALRSAEFTVTIGYRHTRRIYSIPYNEAAVVDHLRSALDLPTGAAKALGEATTVEELLNVIAGLEEVPSDVRDLAERMKSWRGSSLAKHLIDDYALPWMPKFVYFDDYDSMPGKVSLPDLIRRRAADSITRGERALLSLLSSLIG